MRFAVVGARGQLGTAMVLECGRAHEVVAFDKAALDVTDSAAVSSAMRQCHPDVIVNCTGYNAVDAAEDHPVDALQVNALAVRSLARAARAAHATLVHFGSDFVFDGTSAVPYVETDRPNPQSVYAMSKLLGEWFAMDAPCAYVLRVESLFAISINHHPSKGSLAGIVSALKSGAAPKVIVDRTVSPTFVVDAARAVRQLVERRADPGVYHCVNSGSATWLTVAQEVARLLNLEPHFDPVRFEDMKLRATRPRYCALSNAKLAAAGVAMPTWQDALRRYVQDA
jgi:dTDP-4-dehydrorhamnose reductase